MAYTTIKKPSDYFNTVLYSGNNSTQSITGVGHQPDLIWVKARNDTANHTLTDVIRGTNSVLYTNQIQAQDTPNNAITSFDSDGFSLGNNGSFNASGINYASWNWKANGAGSSNTDGSITSTVSANTTSGFSIVKYTGTGSNATVGHGLGSAPSMIFVKGIDVGTTNWLTGGSNISSNWGSSLHLNTTGGFDTYAYWGASAPNATTFGLSTDGALNQSGINFIAYCFAEKKGFSKFGSYVGNGNADGTFVYTGFKPAFVLIKANASADWYLIDNKRSTFNVMEASLKANTSDAESTTIQDMDFLSNGFKPRSTSGSTNGSGTTYIYMAFAEEPLVGDNPATAR